MCLIIISQPMNIVELPVHPMSKRMLLAEYGYEPIRLRHHDRLFEQFRVDPHRISSNLSLVRGTLSTTIQVELNDTLAASLAQRGKPSFRIGIHIYKEHLNMLFTHVAAYVGMGLEATMGIAEFLNKYGIEEDDLAFETAYRYWHREQKRKNKRKNGHSFNNELSVKVSIYTRIRRVTNPVQDRAVQKALKDFFIRYRIWADQTNTRQQKEKRHSKLLIKHMTIYTLRKVANCHPEQIAERTKLKKRSVYKAIHSAEAWLVTYPEIKLIYREVLEQYGLKCPFIGE